MGATCFAIQAGILLVLSGAGVPDTAANAAGFLASAQVNFLLSSAFTWADRRLPEPGARPWAARWVSFQLTVAISLACNTGVFALVSPYLPPVAASAVAVCAGALLTYLASDHLVFRRRKAPQTDHFGDTHDDHRRPAAAFPGPNGRTAAD
ncbi:GtrA family protein [Glycomyces sp. NPDC048151]|uniref:GtrA family protein n=1 Tax=Glycomyces sp. NPDC048151 TaxID=3364002 RepID=UPI0037176161